MNPSDTEINEFIKFLKYYSRFYKPVYEIAENNNGITILPVNRGRNKFKMYSLDEMSKSCSIFNENGFSFEPKTTDAIGYKKHDDGSFYIFIIEFKGDKPYKNSKKCLLIDLLDTLYEKNDIYNNGFDEMIVNLKQIIPKYSDKLFNDLSLKPLETVTIAIPLIYDDYSSNRQRTRSFANRSSILVPAACKKYAQRENDLEVFESYESNLHAFYKRYYMAGIIDDNKWFIEEREFNNFIKNHLE